MVAGLIEGRTRMRRIEKDFKDGFWLFWGIALGESVWPLPSPRPHPGPLPPSGRGGSACGALCGKVCFSLGSRVRGNDVRGAGMTSGFAWRASLSFGHFPRERGKPDRTPAPGTLTLTLSRRAGEGMYKNDFCS